MSALSTARALLDTIVQDKLPLPHSMTFEPGILQVHWMLGSDSVLAKIVLERFDGHWTLHPSSDRYDQVLQAKVDGMEILLWCPRELVDIKVVMK
jgi:hypothetical protein